jgi:putative ABC transport system permease protein
MSFFKSFAVKQSIRLLDHELRRGELTIIFLAIVLAVATVFSLTGFSSQIKLALVEQSSRFIAADRVLESSRPVAQSVLKRSKDLNLKSAEQVLMSSMVFSTEADMLLASLIITSDLYPLRGQLLVSTSIEQQHNDRSQVVHAPDRGQVWVENKILSNLKVKIGDTLEIGAGQFVIAGAIKQLPDASFSLFTAAPIIILNIDDIALTQLVQPASRLTYKYLFAGSKDDIALFSDWLNPQINETQRWYGIKSRQNALAKTLNRAEKYLSLASMLGIILAAVAVAVAARRYSQRHQPSVAVFKAMGASLGYIKTLYLLHWSLLSIVSIIVGIFCGYIIQYLGLAAMAQYLPNNQSASLLYPLFSAVVTGLICAIAFAIIPLTQLINTSPLAAIRPIIVNKLTLLSWQHLPAFLALFTLLLLFSRNWQLSLALLGSGLFVVVVLVLLGRLVMNIGRSVGSQAGQAFQLALANLKRRASENSVQLVSFTIAIKLLLLLLVVRNELLADWQAQLPDKTANRFLINISAQQVAEVEKFVEHNKLAASGLYPVVPGRLIAVNNEKFSQEASKEQHKGADNGRRGIGRELNLTWQAQLPDKNQIVAGKWWRKSDENAQVSIEQRLAKRLAINLGDKLTFQLGSDVFTVDVTSIRKVNWQSMQPNFYMIFNQKVLQDFAATYIASLYIAKNNEQLFANFITQYPTISVLDVDAMINQLRTVIQQVSIAIEFILLLVVLAGSLVLVAQVQASMEERQRDLAILRTLGAKGSLLRNSVLYEFVALGAISGFLASCAMELAVYFLQTRVFEMAASFHFKFWLLAIVAGGLFVGLIGLLSCWRLLTKTALHRYVV